MPGGILSGARTIIWGARPESKLERRFIVKLDCLILTFLCLQYFSNYLDRANLANAYVSGLKEALGLKGHDLNTVNTCFTVGYTIGMIPQNLLLHMFPARIIFPVNTMIWGSLTMVTASAKNMTHLCVIRFFQGIAESSTFVGAHYIMGCWYKESELGKRGAIFSTAAQIATIFSGVLQSTIYTNMDGLQGLAGYQWLFIVCGLITLPIALFGYLFFPDTPETCTLRYFTEEERILAVARLPPKAATKLDRTVFKRVLGHWRWWVMCLIWIVGGELVSIGSNSLMALWLKAQTASGLARYTISDYNYYPSGATAVAIVSLLGTAIWTDHTGKRYQVNFLIATCVCVSSILLLVYDGVPTAAKYFAFYLAGVSYSGQASNFAWATDLTRGDDQERSVILASMNMASNAMNAWWSIVFFPASDAPRWRRGMISLVVLCPLMVLLTLVARFLEQRDRHLTGDARQGVTKEVEEIVRQSSKDEEQDPEEKDGDVDETELNRASRTLEC